MNIEKQKPFRSKKYLEWIRSLPCIITGRTYNVIAHHSISCGLGGSIGGKASDLLAMPLNTEVHAELHHDPLEFESTHDQKKLALQTIEKAVHAGVLKVE